MSSTTAPGPDLPRLLDELPPVVRDGIYVGIGTAVLAFQRAQVRRVELARQFGPQLDELRTTVTRLGEQAPAIVQSAVVLGRVAARALNEALAGRPRGSR